MEAIKLDSGAEIAYYRESRVKPTSKFAKLRLAMPIFRNSFREGNLTLRSHAATLNWKLFLQLKATPEKSDSTSAHRVIGTSDGHQIERSAPSLIITSRRMPALKV